MAWFKKTRKPIASSTAEKPSRVPEGLWVKCPACTQLIYKKELEEHQNVCPKCAHHFRITGRRTAQGVVR
jgi:acetyl-CoA carboxylase carboxyl transferase subunit beta